MSTTSPTLEEGQAPADASDGGHDPSQRPLGLGIGLGTLIGLLLLPWLIVPIFYLIANVIAIATGADFSSDTVNVAALLIALVAVVTSLVLGIAVVAGKLGKGLTPTRGRDA